VVNIGDLMAQWSNDRYVSTAHRVANPPAGVLTRRLSVAFFHQPNYDAVIECLPACSSADNPARYAPITSGQHRLNKLNRSSQAKVA
jgi:isopenicillin N synthase-like dioxygenase